MEKKDSRVAAGMKIRRHPDVFVDLLAITERAGAMVYSHGGQYRYTRLNKALHKKIKELFEKEAAANYYLQDNTGPVYEPVYRVQGNQEPPPELPEGIREKIFELADCLVEESGHLSNMPVDQIKVWMLEVLVQMFSHYENKVTKSPQGKSSSLISKFKKLVDENYIRLSLPKDYAALLFVTPNYLNQVSHRILGKTAGEVIRDRKMQEARRLLANPDLNISQVANNLNFTDPSHFSKFFKKHTGRSPEEFRKNTSGVVE